MTPKAAQPMPESAWDREVDPKTQLVPKDVVDRLLSSHEQKAARVCELERVMTALGCQIASVDDAIKVIDAKNQWISELEAAIEAAPHAENCRFLDKHKMCANEFTDNCGTIAPSGNRYGKCYRHFPDDFACNCWKSKVRKDA